MNTPIKNIRKMLVTQALPYANAPLHLGHILEAVQTDIWTRFQNHNGNVCHFFCADDTHGTPVMLKAKELYTVYCGVCHGSKGAGQGILVKLSLIHI